MQRRQFVLATGSLSQLAWGLLPISSLAQVMAAQQGTDFVRLDKPAPVAAPAGKIEVIEFFWYNCPHCNAFEPALTAWVKKLPKDVVFKRVPIAFRDDFVPQQRLFYALEALGLVEKLHARVFAAIHTEKLNLSTAAGITDWVAKQGVERARFIEQFNSFSVATKASRATQLQSAYRIEGVPTLGVAGRYYTDAEMTKKVERALQVADFLIAKVRAGR